MSAPKLAAAMEDLRKSLGSVTFRYRGWGADSLFEEVDKAPAIERHARAVLATYDARRARKAARAIWAEHRAAGERAGVDAAAFDAAVAELIDLANDWGQLRATVGSDGANPLYRTFAHQAKRQDAARAALRALVLGDGEPT